MDNSNSSRQPSRQSSRRTPHQDSSRNATSTASRPPRKRGGNRKPGHARHNIIITAICIAIAIGGIFIAPYLLTGSAHAAIIRIPAKASASNLTDSLTKYFGSTYASRTLKAFKALGRTPAERHGAYLVPEDASPIQAARILSRGAQTEITLTINGVRQFDPFIDRIASKFDFPASELRDALADPKVLAPYELTPEQAPSLFLNDSYRLFWTATPADLIKKVGDNYLKFWNSENQAKAEALGLTPAQVMILASIVDEESNQLSEKGRIGRLYINRLKKGMRLQADPTVRFALGDFTIKRVTSQHTQSAPAPYNTYRVNGLPPGPIRTTSTSTLTEILNSSPSDDLYMCAKEDFSGFHNFASSYEEHMENARKYQNALNERGIK